jgi:hypothetical protein
MVYSLDQMHEREDRGVALPVTPTKNLTMIHQSHLFPNAVC